MALQSHKHAQGFIQKSTFIWTSTCKYTVYIHFDKIKVCMNTYLSARLASFEMSSVLFVTFNYFDWIITK